MAENMHLHMMSFTGTMTLGHTKDQQSQQITHVTLAMCGSCLAAALPQSSSQAGLPNPMVRNLTPP